MFWQYLNDKNGNICRTVLEKAGVDWTIRKFIDAKGLLTDGSPDNLKYDN